MDLAELVRASCAHTAERESRRRGGPCRLEPDRRRVERIVANLVDNAVLPRWRGRADAGGAATGARRRRGGRRRPGRSPPTRSPEVFDRFSKADGRANDGRQRARAGDRARERRLLGGDILLEEGSRFSVQLPVTGSCPLDVRALRAASRVRSVPTHRKPAMKPITAIFALTALLVALAGCADDEGTLNRGHQACDHAAAGPDDDDPGASASGHAV